MFVPVPIDARRYMPNLINHTPTPPVVQSWIQLNRLVEVTV